MPVGVLTRATLMAARIAAPVSKNQWTQPVAALSEYTMPPALPTNTRPPAIVDCAFDCRSLGKPNAHLSFRRGTSAAVRPAIAASWKRVLLVVTPHPFHRGPVEGSNVPLSVHIARGGGDMFGALANVLPVTNSEMARRSARERPAAIATIGPNSSARSTRSGVMLRSTSRLGARSRPPSWHWAQLAW